MATTVSRLLPAARRYLRAARPLGGRPTPFEAGYLAAAGWVVGTGWLALLLGELGRFSLSALAGAELATAAGLVALLRWRRRRGRGGVRRGPSPSPSTPEATLAKPGEGAAGGVRAGKRPPVGERRWWDPAHALFLAVALLAAGYYLRPFEFVFGDLDPGIYVDTGIALATTGSLAIPDADLRALPADLREALFRDPTRPPIFDLRLLIFYTTDLDRGIITGYGFHLYPALFAVGYALGGIRAELLVTPALALLALTAFYLLARRLFGPVVGLVAATLLAVNVAETWFARYPVAETLVQFLMLGGFLALTLMVDTGARRYGLAAGALFGAVHLAKIEFVFLPVALGGFLLHELWRRRLGPAHLWLAATYLALLLHAVVHAWRFAPTYTVAQWLMIGPLLHRLAPAAVGGGLALAAAAVLWLALRRLSRRRAGALAARAIVLARPALVVGLLTLAAYAYYVRPLGSTPAVPLGSLPFGVIADIANRQSLVRLGWYVGPLGLLLGVLGLALLVGRGADRRSGALIALFVLESLWNLYDDKATPYHFWAARRWLPLIIPGFLLCGGYLLVWLGGRLRWRWPGALVPLGLGLVALAFSLGANLPLLGHTEYRGAIGQIEALAAQVPPEGIVLFDDRGTQRPLATPLQFVGRRTTFVVWEGTRASSSLAAAVAFWEGQGRPVYWVRRDQGEDASGAAPPGVSLTYVSSFVFDVPQVTQPWDARPRDIVRFRVPLRIYRVGAGG